MWFIFIFSMTIILLLHYSVSSQYCISDKKFHEYSDKADHMKKTTEMVILGFIGIWCWSLWREAAG